MLPVISALQKADAGRVLPGELMSLHTTWKIGGPADVLIIPETKNQLSRVLQILQDHNTPWHVFGRGSNLLVADSGIRGAVILLGGSMQEARWENGLLVAGGGYSLIKLAVMAGKAGMTGLEFAGGIPGTVGGAVFMNAGAHGADISGILKQAEVVFGYEEPTILLADELQFAYRHSLLHEKPGIVTEAVFHLEPGDRNEIAGAMAAYKDRRLRTQPLQLACAGSTFRNPPGHHAARLIEAAGLKGMRVGGAEVSSLHANFIINTGNATAKDVLTLVASIRETIHAQYGIMLVPEIQTVGVLD